VTSRSARQAVDTARVSESMYGPLRQEKAVVADSRTDALGASGGERMSCGEEGQARILQQRCRDILTCGRQLAGADYLARSGIELYDDALRDCSPHTDLLHP
jgi:hypothetical protein